MKVQYTDEKRKFRTLRGYVNFNLDTVSAYH